MFNCTVIVTLSVSPVNMHRASQTRRLHWAKHKVINIYCLRIHFKREYLFSFIDLKSWRIIKTIYSKQPQNTQKSIINPSLYYPYLFKPSSTQQSDIDQNQIDSHYSQLFFTTGFHKSKISRVRFVSIGEQRAQNSHVLPYDPFSTTPFPFHSTDYRLPTPPTIP